MVDSARAAFAPLLLLLLLWVPGCRVGAAPAGHPAAADPATTAHVISNGWHTGLVVARKDIPPELLPEIEDFPRARYLEFGWGDRAYYPHPDPGVGLALAALLKPTAAVMHIAGHTQPPRAAGRAFNVLAVPLTAGQMRKLLASIDASFDRAAGDRAAAVASGLYAESLFYPATGRFHLYRTCNSWTAQQLAAAGIDLPRPVIRARPLMSALARRVRSRTPALTSGADTPQ